MINVSFYLLSPGGMTQSQVYVSIRNKEKRMRFSTGVAFITNYCNIRGRRGKTTFVKRSSPFYFEYTSRLNEIRDSLMRFDMELERFGEPYTLEHIRDAYYLKIGKTKSSVVQLSFEQAFTRFIVDTKSQWTMGTYNHFTNIRNHIEEFEVRHGKITMKTINENFWNTLRDQYFVDFKQFGNSSTNNNLKKLKQFIKYATKKNMITHRLDLEDLKFLEEIEPFKIALKEHEVEALIKHDFSQNERLDRVRDLFAIEILTGQRFSDLPKLMDRNNFSDTSIQIYQQKTGEKVNIPIHPRLKTYLIYFFEKYPEGLPSITNQKFNEYLKDICQQAGITKEHSWVTLSGKNKTKHCDKRYNLVTSHTGRRTFCTLALKSGINPEMIMKVTGHRKYDQFREYVKVDDEDLEMAFGEMMREKKNN